MDRVFQLRVLHFEDNPEHAKIFEFHLKEAKVNYRLTQVPTAAAGLAFLDKLQGAPPEDIPNLIVLDLGLPDMAGTEALRELKAHPVAAAIPVMVLTSSEDKEDLVNSYKGGAVTFVSKLASEKAFLEALHQLRITSRLKP